MMDSRRMFTVLALTFLALAALIGWTYYNQRDKVDSVVKQSSTTKNAEDDGKMCAQVVTVAQNENTGEVQAFPDACIPAGWKAISPAPTDNVQ